MRRSHPGYRPWSCEDHAGRPASHCRRRGRRWCMVFYIRRGGVRWALQVRVLHAPAVAGHTAIPDSLVEVRASTLGGPGDTWRSRTPRGGSGAPAAGDGHPSSRGPWQHRTPSRAGGGPGAIRMVRWSPDGRNWRNSVGSSGKPVLSSVAGPTVLLQHPGWRSGDRSQRMGDRKSVV